MKVALSENDKTNLKCFGRFEHTCSVCGKEFECTAEYVYKRNGKRDKSVIYFCSWKCYRIDEAEREKNKVYNRRVI